MFKRSSTEFDIQACYLGLLITILCILYLLFDFLNTPCFTLVVMGRLLVCCSRSQIMSLDKTVEYAESCNHCSCLIYCGWFGVCNCSKTIMLLSCNYLAFTEGKQKCLRESLLKKK